MRATVLRQYFALALVAIIVLFAMTAAPAFAFHPGEDRDGTVPQGPHQTACDNEGRGGIDEAIERGGAVHCEEEDPGDPDGGN